MIRPPEEPGAFCLSLTKMKGINTMIIVMKKGPVRPSWSAVSKKIIELGYQPHIIHGETRNVVGAVGRRAW